MALTWQRLQAYEDISTIVAASHDHPQVIFKHSTTCPISSMAKMRLEDHWDLSHVSAHYLDLLSYRTVSSSIAEQLGVHHESPQVILLVDGEVIYDASHLDISIIELKEALAYAKK